MATKRKAGSSVAALQKQKAALKSKISAQNKKKNESVRAAKLRREIESLKSKLKTTTKRTTRKK